MHLRQKSSFAVSLVLFSLAVLLSLSIIACSNGMMTAISARQMQSITVTPTSAVAQNFPGGQVQFTATGHFNMDPMTATPQVLWTVGSPFPMMPMSSMSSSMTTPTASEVSISANGIAQCNGFVGTVTIQATAPMDPNMSLSQMSSMIGNVTGTAQLTCR